MAKIVDLDFNEPAGSAKAADTAGPIGEDGDFRGSATSDGMGNAQFNGSDGYIEVPPAESLGLDQGTLTMSFVQKRPSEGDNPGQWPGAQTLVSVDSNGNGDGHLTIYIDSDGNLMVRHQTELASMTFGGGTIVPGEPAEVAYSWGPDGGQLVVNGETVAKSGSALRLGADVEPMIIGASQVRSTEGTADRVQGFFDGEISRFQIYDEPMSAIGALPCFAAGTLIGTPGGTCAVERLAPGDVVLTFDAGPQPLTSVLSRRYGAADLAARPGLRPVVIARSVLGAEADLVVSRQHCLAVETSLGPRLVRANRLAGRLAGVRVAQGRRRVDYVHLLLGGHHIVAANGVAAETLLLGPAVRAAHPELAPLPEMARALPLAAPLPPGPLGPLRARALASADGAA